MARQASGITRCQSLAGFPHIGTGGTVILLSSTWECVQCSDTDKSSEAQPVGHEHGAGAPSGSLVGCPRLCALACLGLERYCMSGLGGLLFGHLFLLRGLKEPRYKLIWGRNAWRKR